MELSEQQKTQLDVWWANWHSEKKWSTGLWICGPRGSGTSSIAAVVCQDMTPRTRYSGYSDDGKNIFIRVTAADMVRRTRELWSYEGQLRDHGDDGVWQSYETERRQQQWWYDGRSILWVDDLHGDVIDVSFWRKHVQPEIEAVIKEGAPVIVCTTLLPSHDKLAGLQQVIEELFVVVDAGR